MNYELTEQSIQYVFGNKKYKNGQKTRNLKNVKTGAKADELQKVGQAIASLQEDSLDEAYLVQKSRLVPRSEEHTSELQSRFDLVCRLLLEKKTTNDTIIFTYT